MLTRRPRPRSSDPKAAMTLFELSHLSVEFPAADGTTVPAVSDVSLAVDAGRTVAVVGESGSGKTVSLLAATGLLDGAVVGGSARFDGVELNGLEPRRRRALLGARIGFVFQDPASNLHPFKRVGAQIAEAVRVHRRGSRAEVAARVASLLADVGLDGEARIARAYPAELSGGQRQRIMIAIAIANDPALIIADEPTTALDASVQASVLRLFRRIQESHGTAIVLVSHDLGVAGALADDIVVVRDGRVVESGEARGLVSAPGDPYTRELVLAAQLHALPAGGVAPSHRRRGDDGAPVLRVSGLAKSYRAGRRRRPVVDGIGFDVAAGSITALVGESGAGKSTVGRIAAGLQYADAGVVEIAGVRLPTAVADGVPPLSPQLRAEVQLVFQDPYTSLNPRKTVAETIATARAVRPEWGHATVRSRVREVAAQARLDPGLLDRRPHELSGGQRQRTAIARALFPRPRLLVADEALSALDVTTQRQVILLLEELRDTQDLAILLITHDLGVVATVADAVVVLGPEGQEEAGEVDRVFGSPRSAYTRLLLDAVPRLDGRVAG
ncbi:Oligopeptide transport ATP-binding protein OppF (TC 3.A.1.5.1) [Mycetocola reblochoni REB411]|uniref:Oligopeptide transport ATP-binding protein OppF (TC 3.A.1.5.1) n=2 Tax=Mycetocola reblochoni TaxID=331618 RepID=A0A1R4IV62_9MICO|nr:Oligopeptide transport ATP-binding protein OppF (TC 3.A.1.5.1) [Mycetocola reblochoni REB411]